MGYINMLTEILFVLVTFQVGSEAKLSSVKRITAGICPDYSSGTGDTVYIELLVEGTAYCLTKWNGGSWGAGKEEVIEGTYLGSCSNTGFDFDTVDKIEARVVIDDSWGSGGWLSLGYDAVSLCYVNVEVGGGSKEVSFAYTWRGQQWWEEQKGEVIMLEKSFTFLKRITARVCDESYSGTDDTIYLEFFDDQSSCRTKNNDEWGNNWSTDSIEILSGEDLGDCKFINPKEIKGRVIIDYRLFSGGWATGYDGLQLCSIRLDFKDYRSNGYIFNTWNGKQWWEEYAGPLITFKRTAPLDYLIAPNAYTASVVRHTSLWNGHLNEESKPFDLLTPQLVIRGTEKNALRTTVDWEQLKEKQENGQFNRFVKVHLDKQLGMAKKLVIVTHGWNDGNIEDCTDTWVSDLAQKIGNFENDNGRTKTATIAMCWNSHYRTRRSEEEIEVEENGGNICHVTALVPKNYYVYFHHARSTGKVGELLAKLVQAIKTEFPNIQYVHGIGHSLGAHVMGNIFNLGGVKIDRISGLDPAGPCFEKSFNDIHLENRSWGLHKDAAFFVDNIHTDGDMFGTYFSKGHIDFFTGDPNYEYSGAGVQPTCNTCKLGCCHSLAIDYFNQSIGSNKHKYLTSYVTKSQNEETYEARSIGEPVLDQRICAGYHADPNIYNEKENFLGRMFLPIFYANGTWSPICDIENLPEEEQTWCFNAGYAKELGYNLPVITISHD